MSAAAVELRNVFCVHRSVHGDAAALQGLNLKLRHGERICVLGPSGAGKTTLLRVLAGLQTPSAGSVLVFGTDIGRQPARKRARLRHRLIGFLDQRSEATLSPDLSIADAVALPLALRGTRRSERQSRVNALLRAAGLGDRAGALPGQLSGGERQRAALCAALAPRPALLLADEPTAELDEASAGQMAELIDELGEAEGTTVVAVSHDPALAAAARRVVRIREGRIVEERRDGSASLVIGHDGWIRLPEPLLDEAGIGERARAAVIARGLLLTALDRRGAATPGPVAMQAPLPRSGSPAVLELDRASRSRGRGAARRTVIDELTVNFEPGRLTVVTGRSGSGKTTLLKLLACLERPDSGQVRLDGEPLARADTERLAWIRRRRIGFLSQEPEPVGFLSAAENVALALRIKGHDGRAAVAAADAVLTRIGLTDRTHQRVARLSAGEAQRVALARALACADGLLVVDEPTSRLDTASAAMVAGLLTEAARGGQTVICATHDPLLIERADRTLSLNGGRIGERHGSGSTDEAQPAAPGASA
jgi:ABC-type lipoprotein export system ATPase subunit